LVDRRGVIYYAAGDAVSAIAPDGSVRWRRAGLTAPAPVALTEDGRLWVRTGDPAVLALDAITGGTKAEALLAAFPVSGQLGGAGTQAGPPAWSRSWGLWRRGTETAGICGRPRRWA